MLDMSTRSRWRARRWRIVRFATSAIHVHRQRAAILGDEFSLAIIRHTLSPAESRDARNGCEGTAFERPDLNLPDSVVADRSSAEDQWRGAIGLIADGLEGLESHFLGGVVLRPCLRCRQRGNCGDSQQCSGNDRGTAISFCSAFRFHARNSSWLFLQIFGFVQKSSEDCLWVGPLLPDAPHRFL